MSAKKSSLPSKPCTRLVEKTYSIAVYFEPVGEAEQLGVKDLHHSVFDLHLVFVEQICFAQVDASPLLGLESLDEGVIFGRGAEESLEVLGEHFLLIECGHLAHELLRTALQPEVTSHSKGSCLLERKLALVLFEAGFVGFGISAQTVVGGIE